MRPWPPSARRSTPTDPAIARIVAAGPDALRTLATPGEGAVAHIVSGGAYLRLNGDRWLFLSNPRAPMGPLSLRFDRPLPDIRAEDTVTVTSASLHIGRRFIVHRSVPGTDLCTTSTRECHVLCPAPAALRTLGAALARLPVAPVDLGGGLRALREGDLLGAVVLLAGRGDGLTPAGDDVLAGYAAWAAFTDGPSAVLSQTASGRSSPLGLAYLRCAERGEVAEPAERLLMAALTGDVPGAQRAAGALREWGASSGTALAWGMAACAAGTRPTALPHNVSRG